MHWKLSRDPFLGPIAARLGEQAARDAGFFFDEDPEDAPLDDVDWHCTPVPPRRPLGGRPIALLATGGFCPVHGGHIAMMEAARAAARDAGFDVVVGYLSPGHDAYLRAKCGAEAIPASERLRLCGEAAARTDWLLADPWEALYRRVAVNYTDVVARLRAYLRAHVDRRIDVFYVCGGDNARFASAFVDDGGCVVVGRPGWEAEGATWRARLGNRPNILWCDAEHSTASRDLRGGPWLDRPTRRIVVRLEDARATPGLDRERWLAFQRELLQLFGEFASVRDAPVQPPAGVSREPTISLDAMLPGDSAIAISRLYALGGYQALGHVARPGWPPLTEQIRALAPGDYVLRDDDSVTGGTVSAVRSLLPADVRITRLELAVHQHSDEEVVDSRDFLLGAHEGGLVVRLPGDRIGRVPYLSPYVDPAVRCNVPASLAVAFSRRVWQLNERAFRGTGLTVGDLPDSSPSGLSWLGSHRTLEDVARFHATSLRRFA
jgi:hypothetical protein